MFQLTRKIDYGLVLLTELNGVRQNGDVEKKPLSLRILASKRFLSFLFLQKVAMDLKKAGLIEATRGKTGGYLLTKNPEEITLKAIFEAIEGKTSIMYCMEAAVKDSNKERVHEFGCRSRRGLQMLNDDIKQSMNRITLADFIEPITSPTFLNTTQHVTTRH